MNNPFKVGDKVVVSPHSALNNGRLPDRVFADVLRDMGDLTVTKVSGSSVLVKGNESSDVKSAHMDRFMLASEVPKAAPNARKEWIIIARDAVGRLAPASRPVRYMSREHADTVSRIMAEKHPGQTFVVFEAVAFSIIPALPKATTTPL